MVAVSFDHRAGKIHAKRPLLTARIVKRQRPSSGDVSDGDSDGLDMSDSDARMESQSAMKRVKRDRSTFGLRDSSQIDAVDRIQRHSQKHGNLMARKGESDRAIREAKPKHLYSGKRKQGTHSHR